MPNLSTLAAPSLLLAVQMSPFTIAQQTRPFQTLPTFQESQSTYVVGRPIREGGPATRPFYDSEGRVTITGGAILNCRSPLELRRASRGFFVDTSGCELEALENPYRYLLTHASPTGPELTTIVTHGRPLLEPQRVHAPLPDVDRVFLDGDGHIYARIENTIFCARPPQITSSGTLRMNDCYDRSTLENQTTSANHFEAGLNLGHYVMATLSLGLGIVFLFQKLMGRKER